MRDHTRGLDLTASGLIQAAQAVKESGLAAPGPLPFQRDEVPWRDLEIEPTKSRHLDVVTDPVDSLQILGLDSVVEFRYF